MVTSLLAVAASGLVGAAGAKPTTGILPPVPSVWQAFWMLIGEEPSPTCDFVTARCWERCWAAADPQRKQVTCPGAVLQAESWWSVVKDNESYNCDEHKCKHQDSEDVLQKWVTDGQPACYQLEDGSRVVWCDQCVGGLCFDWPQMLVAVMSLVPLSAGAVYYICRGRQARRRGVRRNGSLLQPRMVIEDDEMAGQTLPLAHSSLEHARTQMLVNYHVERRKSGSLHIDEDGDGGSASYTAADVTASFMATFQRPEVQVQTSSSSGTTIRTHLLTPTSWSTRSPKSKQNRMSPQSM